jgi:chitinase
LDLDWEYPKCWQVDCNAGPASDKANFATWVRELKQAFQPHGLLLSAAVSPSKKVVNERYDVPTINQYLDWIAVMAYDFHGHWDSKTGHVAPLSWHPLADYDYFNANFTMHYWKQQGADAKKLIMGMPLYGQAFALANPSEHGLGAPDRGKAQAGEFTRAAGFLAYYEICDRVQNKGWTQVQDPQKRIGPYAYQGNQWVGYDDVAMIRKKSEYVVQNGFGGAMIWALDLDDFRNVCGCEPHPLLRTINRVLRGYSVPDPNCSI